MRCRWRARASHPERDPGCLRAGWWRPLHRSAGWLPSLHAGDLRVRRPSRGRSGIASASLQAIAAHAAIWRQEGSMYSGGIVLAVAGQPEQRGDHELRAVAGAGALGGPADHARQSPSSVPSTGGLPRRSRPLCRPDRRRQTGASWASSRRIGYSSPRGAAAGVPPPPDSALRERRRWRWRLRRSRRRRAVPVMPRKRRAMSAPFTTGIIAQRWLIIGSMPLARPAAVHIAVAPAHRAERRAHVGARGIEQALAEGEAPGLVADERGEDIALAQGEARWRR